MARKPNYNFERKERERIRAQKKADRQRTKEARIEARKASNPDVKTDAQDDAS